MKHLNNNNLILALTLVAVMALNIVVLSPSTASAYITTGDYTYCDGACVYDNNSNNNGNNNGNNGNFNPNVLDKNSVPTVYSTTPNEAGVNDGVKSITIFGTGFKPDSIARWNSVDRPTTFVNANKLIMHLDPEDTITPGKYQVSVVTPSPEGGRFSNTKIVNLVKGSVLGKVAGASTTAKASSSTSGSYTQNGTTNTTKVATTKSSSTVKTKSTTEKVASVNTTASDKLKSNLVGAVINGDNSVMPNSVIEWLVLFALILFSVILFRKLWLTPLDHAKPLKHA